MKDEERIKQTLRAERYRAFASGIVETGSTSFFLLIALRWFDAGPITKALLASAPQVGLLFGPLIVYIAGRYQLASSSLAAKMMTCAAVFFLVAAIVPNQSAFVTFVVLGVGATGACVPLFTSIYHTNYPASSLGKFYSQVSTIKILTSIVTAFTVGLALNGRIGLYPLLIWAFAAFTFLAARKVHLCPSPTLEARENASVLSGFRFLTSDRTFRNTLVFWMIMGFGTLMLAPLRVEYLAHQRYGLLLSEAEIALLVSTIPSIARLFASRIWGWLFDNLSFFTLRITVNTGFMLGALAFFCSDDWLGLTVAAILYGISMAGGDVAWSLWTTKFAPPGRVADYMAVHTAFTGIRGLIAPMVGFSLALQFSIITVAILGIFLIGIANVGLIFEGRRKTSPI